MLPSKGYFNSLECPFYLSPTKCLRPYCHFKHPRRDPQLLAVTQKVDDHIEDGVTDVTSTVTPVASENNSNIAPGKHIPIACPPTKPTAVLVNTKKPKIPYVPTCKRDFVRSNLYGPVDYHPSTITDSSEKTYSRYSYEKGHDSGDEIMENHKSLIEINQIGRFDDGSKSGYDDETDDFTEEPVFSPPLSPSEEDVDVQLENTLAPTELPLIKKELNDKPNQPESPKGKNLSYDNKKEIKCKKKRKHSEISDSSINDKKKSHSGSSHSNDKSEKSSNKNHHHKSSSSSKKIKIEDDIVLKSIKVEKDDEYESLKDVTVESNADLKKTDKKICKHKDRKLSDKEKDNVEKKSSSSKKNSSEKAKNEEKPSKSSSSNHKKHSSVTSKKSEGEDKHVPHSAKDSSENSKKHSSKGKKHSTSKKSDSKASDDTKKHSSTNNKKSTSDKHSTDKKKQSSHNQEKHEKSKSSIKNKESSHSHKHHSKNKNESDDKKHLEKSKDKSKSLTKNKVDHGKSYEAKSHSKHSKESDSRKRKKRSQSDSSCSITSEHERKETILISDSSDSINSELIGVDDIFGSSDSDEEAINFQNNNHQQESDSDSNHDSLMHTSNLNKRPSYSSSSFPSESSDPPLLGHKEHFRSPPHQGIEEEPVKASQTTSKVRIAHVPNVSSLLSAKNLISSGKTVPPAVKKLVSSLDTSKVVAATQRAPLKASTSRPKPQVATDVNSVIALSIRQPGLNNIYEELLKFIDYDEAYRRSIEEEKEICNVATNPQSYRNRIALSILKIRKSKGAVDVVQKEKITSNSIPDYTYGLTLYECFSKYLLQPEDFLVHGYPLEISTKPGCAYIDKNSHYRNKHVDLSEEGFRKCLNCGKEYAVDEETGIPLAKNNCHYHWGKLIRIRQGKIYTCCKSEVGSDPCHIAIYHVTELKNDDCLEGFVKTRPYPSDADPNKAGIYAVDCEMCLTTKGRDIVRASILAIDNETVYDILIKPRYPILDYCTRFSGITEEKLESVTTTLKDVQKFLLKFIYDKTILVGHSLENDLKALKILHFNVVDTSVMFPHKEGLPIKCALRTLCSRILGSAIQTGEHGHDSLEDARGSLQLVLHQVKQDAKSRKPRIVKQLKTNK